MNAEDIAKKIRKSRAWDHDIKFVDGKYIEDVVLEYQKAHAEYEKAKKVKGEIQKPQRAKIEGCKVKSEILLEKIVKNYAIYRLTWGKGFAQFIDSVEDGEIMHDEIIWKCCLKFKSENCLKEKGKAFNAYYVSACLHQMKNLKSSMEALKNNPRVPCPICHEDVPNINAKHLTHEITLERYKKTYRNHVLVSPDGTTVCPFSGERIPEITETIVNRHAGYYAVQDYVREFGDAEKKGSFRCPVSGLTVGSISTSYLASLLPGYTMEEFVRDFPGCSALVTCGISGDRVASITQGHLDQLLRQKGRRRLSLAEFAKTVPTLTFKAKQEDVINPYTGEKVKEITLEMLRKAGTSVKQHLGKHATLVLNYNYPKYAKCPFTGRSMKMFTKEYLMTIGKTVYDFYQITSKYPLKRWTVKCAVCGEWVPNIWDHLDNVKHSYAPPTTVEEFENEYGSGSMKAIVSTNSYVTNSEGESVHVADLFPSRKRESGGLELSEELDRVAEDPLDKEIARSVRNFQSLEDIWHSVAKENIVTLKEPLSSGTTLKSVSNTVATILGTREFEMVGPIPVGKREIKVFNPSKNTVKEKLAKMILNSEIGMRLPADLRYNQS